MSKQDAMTYPLVTLVAVAIAAVGTSACARQSGEAMSRLTAAAHSCGFEHPQFKLQAGTYLLNETI